MDIIQLTLSTKTIGIKTRRLNGVFHTLKYKKTPPYRLQAPYAQVLLVRPASGKYEKPGRGPS